MLAALLDRAASTRADALILAGDIYDRSIPPPDAVRLFDQFLTALYETLPGILTIAIPGNHDSAARLSFGSSLLAARGLHIRTTPADLQRPVILTKDSHSCRFWPLPFLGAGSLLPSCAPDSGSRSGWQTGWQPHSDTLTAQEYTQLAGALAQAQPEPEPQPETARILSQSDLIRRAVGIITGAGAKDREHGGTNILIAHCFVTGSATSDSERSFVGTAEQVDSSVLEHFDYVALGHLHRCQSPGTTGRLHYPGSPLAYSFGESGQDKGFLLVDVQEDSPGASRISLDFLPHVPLRRMRRIKGSFASLYAPPPGFQEDPAQAPGPLLYEPVQALPLLQEAPDAAIPQPQDASGDYIEAILTDAEPVLNPLESLRSRYPNILSVRQLCFDSDTAAQDPASGSGESATRKDSDSDPLSSVLSDFQAFHVLMKGEPPEEALLDLFTSIAREAADETL